MLYWSRMSICGSNSVQGRGEGSIVRGGSPSFLGIREVMENNGKSDEFLSKFELTFVQINDINEI